MALTQISTDGIKNGTITGSDLATNVDLVDNQKLRLGAGNDLEIYHDGTDSRIVDSGTGELRLDSNSLRIRNAAGTETSAVFVQDGACELRFNNVKKFETTSDGAEVDGLATNFTIRSGTASGNAGGFINFKNVDGNGQPRDVVRIKGFSDGTGGYGELTLQTAFNNTLNDCLVIKKEKNRMKYITVTALFLFLLKITNFLSSRKEMSLSPGTG